MAIRLNLGCGPHRIDGYIGVDIIPTPAVDILASVDRLPFPDHIIDEILTEHLVEHLAYFQFNRSIAEWYRVLKLDGLLIIECPDLLGLCKQFVEANEYKRYHTSGNYWPIINQIYGHQLGNTESMQLAQVHKNGFTEEHLRFVLNGVGYREIIRVPHQKGPPDAAILRLECRK